MNCPSIDANAEFYIVDLRSKWQKRPYISFWRPGSAGYAYPLIWAGKYTKAEIDRHASYFSRRDREQLRFPVLCVEVEKLAIQTPADGLIDGNSGPVVLNTAKIRLTLKLHRYLPPIKADDELSAAEQELRP